MNNVCLILNYDQIRLNDLRIKSHLHQVSQEAAKLKETYGEKPVVELEGPSMLGCQGVFFKCPAILDANIILPQKEMQKQIRDFLYEQVNSEDKGLTACLIIHTLNKDSEKVYLSILAYYKWN